jgi:hypothetical protein
MKEIYNNLNKEGSFPKQKKTRECKNDSRKAENRQLNLKGCV